MIEFTILLALIGLNGLFALSELAVVSARKQRLRMMAEQGRAGAGAALALAENPGRFLSTVQIGITLVGVLAGAVSGATLGAQATDALEGAGVPDAAADALGYGLVIGAITYLSVVVGELVPKHLALRNPEAIACVAAPPMTALSRIAAPIVWLLDASTRLIFRLIGQNAASDNAVTEEEIRSIVAEAENAGVIETDERLMIGGVLRLGDRPVRGVMTPRTDVDWLDLSQPEEAIRQALIETPHSRMPVVESGPDNVVGVVQSRDLLAALLAGRSFAVRDYLRPAPVIPDTVSALDALTTLREAEVPMAVVHDEYGHFEGVVTPADILDAIAGAFRSDEAADAEPEAVQREDGSWLLAGWMPADEMADQIGVTLPESRDYQTVAGLVIAELNHLPETGETVDAHGWVFEVVDMDGRRIDKVLARRAA